MSKKMHISFILDETGSMDTYKSQTISGFNEYIKTLRKDKTSKRALFTLTKFNSVKVETVYANAKLTNVELLDNKNYQPQATTPLYDAIGRTINSIRTNKDDSVLVVIQTDGEENSSKEYTREAIFKLIEEKKKEGWTFAFLGADQDAWAAAILLGISKGNAMSYSSADSVGAFSRVATATVNYASNSGKQTSSLFEND